MAAALAQPHEDEADWHRRVVGRSLQAARQRSIDRGAGLIRAAATLLERSGGAGFTVQEVAEEAGQSLRTLYLYFESKDDLLLAVFEEGMRAYARIVADAIVDLDDPLDRLAGALLAARRLPEQSPLGVKGGLSRLRLKLSEVDPELVGRAQAPVASVLTDLVAAAVDAGQLPAIDPEAATFLLLTLNTASIHTTTLGNDVGVRAPDVRGVVDFCLRGLGAKLPAERLDRVDARLRLPKGKLRLSWP